MGADSRGENLYESAFYPDFYFTIKERESKDKEEK